MRVGSDRDNTPLEPYLDSSVFIRRVMGKLEERHQVLEPLKDPYGFSCCLPNPKYDPTLRDRVETEPARQDLAVLQQDMLAHWGPRALVVPAEDGTGWAFTGREQLMARLIEFTAGPSGALVVSGRAGSGKSAVLARLVTCSDSLFREAQGELLARTQPVPPEGAVDIAVLATGKTPHQIATQIAGALGAAAPEPALPGTGQLDALMDAIAGVLALRDELPTVVIDALDEANDPAGVVLTVLQRLNPVGSPRMRLLVGVRSSGKGNEPHSSEQGRELVDLVTEALSAEQVAVDAGQYWQPGDLAAYVEQILGQAASPYRGHPEMARRVAFAVEEGVGRSYLLALLIATQLVDRPEPVDADEPVLAQLVEGGVASILDRDLATSLPDPTDRRRAGLLLTASALAFGRGVPWRGVWPVLANAITPTGQQVGDRDIEWLLQHRVGGYLVRDIEDGATVYRPFHDALRASLSRHRGPHHGEPVEVGSPGLHISVEQAHRLIAHQLLSLVDGNGRQPPPDYVRRHLADHAAAGGILDETILTTESLPYLDETRLSHLLRLTEAPPQSVLWLLLSAWRGIRHRWSWERPESNAAALDMALTAIGGWTPSRRPLTGLTWQPRWAQWSWGGTVISSEERGAASIAFGTVEGRPVLAVGVAEQVRLWDAATGQAIGLPLKASDQLRAVAMANVRGVPIVAAATVSGTVALWDAATGLLRRQLDADGDSLRTVAFGALDDRMIVAAGGGAGRVWLWDAASGAPVVGPLGSGVQVRALALATDMSGRCRLAAGRQDGHVEQWTVVGEEAVSGPTIDVGAEVNAVAWGAVDGRSVLATAASSGLAQLWDAETTRPTGVACRHHAEIRDVALSEVGGTQLLATASFDRSVVLWDPRTGGHDAPLPHPLQVHHVAFGDVDGRTMLATACADGITRLWDPVRPSGTRATNRDRMGQVTLLRHRDTVLLAACGDTGTAYLWAGDDGQLLAEFPLSTSRLWGFPSMKGAHPEARVALGVLSGRPVLATEFEDVVNLHDINEPARDSEIIIRSGDIGDRRPWAPRALSLDGGQVLLAVASRSWQCVELVDLLHQDVVSSLADSANARSLVFLSSTERRALAVAFEDRVQLYDPVTGGVYGSSIPISPWTYHFAMDTIDGIDILATWGEPGIQLWDIATGDVYAPPIPTSSVPHGLAFGRVNGREILLSAHYATVRVWNPRTGRHISELPFGTSIEGMAAAATSDDGLLVTVGGPGIAVTELRDTPPRR